MAPDSPRAVKQVYLSDPQLGLVAKCDIVEERPDGTVVPIDYKKGAAPDIPPGAWEPERVQVCAQALLLRAHNYRCDVAVLWFHTSRRRVEVPITEELVARTLALRDEARLILSRPPGELPPPLMDSPKCRGCALVGICLPDEVNMLIGRPPENGEPRPFIPARDDGVPLHVVLQGGSVGKDGGEIVVKDKGQVVARARIEDTSSVILHGNASITTAVLGALLAAEVPISVHSWGGWFQGMFVAPSGPGGALRAAQHLAAGDPERSMAISRALIQDKIWNSRVLLRRNGDPADSLLAELRSLERTAGVSTDMATLLGLEGLAARLYFGAFSTMIRADLRDNFDLDGRNRRPPRDPINALLSFAYACLTREWSTALQRVGFDHARGFLHQPRAGRPALALDLMEPFRPVVADSVVITCVNNGSVGEGAFLIHPTGVSLTDAGRRAFLLAWERRLDEMATHPVTGTRLSMRRIFELHARLIARHLLGEVPRMPEYRIR